jgi:hypothetical protein
MTSNPLVSKVEVSQPKVLSTLAVVFVIAATGFVLFANSAATARQMNPLSGSGELLGGPLTAPGAVRTAGDPSVPDAAEALRGPGSEVVVAENAPSF